MAACLDHEDKLLFLLIIVTSVANIDIDLIYNS